MKKCSLFILSTFIVCGCSFAPPNSVSKSIESSEVETTQSGESSSVSIERSDFPTWNYLEPNASFLEVFELSSKVELKLTFEEEALHDLSYYGANFDRKYSDVYFPAKVEISVNGKKEIFEEAGVRMKGNTSRREIVDEDGRIYDSCHFKVSLKATFDDSLYSLAEFAKYRHDWSGDSNGRSARKDRNFRGIEKFDLKFIPRNLGSCYGQEIYAYSSFRKAGLLAPHANYASLALENGVSSWDGQYEIIETIDKEFLKRYLGKSEAKGDLYKCTYGRMGKANLARSGAVDVTYDEKGYSCGSRASRGKIGVKDAYDLYFPCYDLKTNDDGERSDFSSMANYINAMWNVRYKDAGQDLLESALDVDRFLRFEAISFLLGNFDDQRNNSNNYYLYFLPSTGQAIYIPYDWDWCLGADMGLNVKEWGPYRSSDMNGEQINTNVYYNTIFRDSNPHSYSVEPYQTSYDAYIKQGVEMGILDFENYEAQLKAASIENGDEKSSVRDYMNRKKQVIANYYK